MSGADDYRLRRIESVTDAALAHLDVEDLLLDECESCSRSTQRPCSCQTLPFSSLLLPLPGDRSVGPSGDSRPDREGLRRPRRGRDAAGDHEQVDHANVIHTIPREHGICSLLGVPRLISGMVIGVLHVGTLVPRHFTDDDVRLLQIVADRVALAAQFRRAEIERTAARVLQRSLLPAQLPVVLVLGVELAPLRTGGESRRQRRLV
jgi:GAF domain-containing protein